MSGIQSEDGSPSYRNWTTGSELNETREAFLTPSSDYDDEEFLRYLWKEYLHPKEYEWALIAGYIVVFIVALVGNVLGASRPHRVEFKGIQSYFLDVGFPAYCYSPSSKGHSIFYFSEE
ncbi:orexin receptor type 2 [Grus japonensis]|uniref:Orexin receptor type 2 n=1 Tax=Grus japonensis TaxID=30415 RepID=A0ABC9WKC3_GRUJA